LPKVSRAAKPTIVTVLRLRGNLPGQTSHLLATRGSLHGTECQQTENDAAPGIKASLHHPAKRYNSLVTLSLVQVHISTQSMAFETS
jgi:hypothetical protein